MIFEKETLKEFLRNFFTIHRAPISHPCEGDDDLWIVDVPSHLLRFFEGKGKLRLCFNRDLLRFHSDFSFVTLGSPVFSQVKEAYNKDCLVTSGFVHVEKSALTYAHPVPPTASFVMCLENLKKTRFLYRPLVRFNFKLIISTDEIKEEIFPILIDGSSGRTVNVLLVPLQSAGLSGTPQVDGKTLPGKPFRALLERAHESAEKKLLPLIRHLECEIEQKTSLELQTAKEYFEREYARYLKDRKVNLADFERNRNKHFEEIKSRHTCSFELHLLSVLLYYVPVARNSVEISRNGRAFPFIFDYDLVRKTHEESACPRCSMAITEFHCCEEHGICCQRDIWHCAVCRKERCRLCDSVQCGDPGCRKKVEPSCTFKCVLCSKILCTTHRRQCVGCGKKGCDKCIRESDQAKACFCPRCIATCVTCRKTFSSKFAARCEVCNETICPSCQAGPCQDRACGAKVLCGAHSRVCASCGKTFCHKHTGKCHTCGKDFCRGDRKRCSQCNLEVCHKHREVCEACGKEMCSNCAGQDMKRCHKDNRLLCSRCQVLCPICGKTNCSSHMEVCPECRKVSCASHFATCSKCGSITCSHCNSMCSCCRRRFCIREMNICPSCEKYSCGSHYRECTRCGMDICALCSKGDHGLCPLCRDIESRKEDHLISRTSHIVDAFIKANKSSYPGIVTVGKWYIAKGKNYNVLQGSSLGSHMCFSVGKDNKKVFGHRRWGVIEGLKGIFGIR